MSNTLKRFFGYCLNEQSMKKCFAVRNRIGFSEINRTLELTYFLYSLELRNKKLLEYKRTILAADDKISIRDQWEGRVDELIL